MVAALFLKLISPMVLLGLGFSTIQTSASSDGSVTLAEKQRALHEPVSLISVGHAVEANELPKSTRAGAWQRRLKNDRPISLVSIPATHDAGTALGRYGMTRCQILTIPAQLEVGVRGYDIRLRLVGSDLQIYHGPEDQHVTFASVMRAFDAFLAAHPTEFLVMRVREETKASRPTESFESAFVRHIAPYASRFYRATSRTEIPTVGQLRGKIIILDNYGKLPDAVDYPNPSMSVQDDYDTNDMDHKYAEIVAKFEDALGRKDGSVWDVNYTSSCTAQVDQLANARAVNAKFQAYLKGKRGNLGLVLMNFPSVDVIQSIIRSNF